jgi:regulatory protein
MTTYIQECKQSRQAKKPLDATRLKDLALAYVARYATSGARLERYLKRKIREQGWADESQEPEVARLVERFSALGYVDDAGFARGRSDSLLRRGYGARRIAETLGHDGIDADIQAQLDPGEARLRHAVLALALRRRFGPFAAERPDRERREKQVAAMLRAGHSLDFARKIVDAPSPQAAQDWAHELDDDDRQHS